MSCVLISPFMSKFIIISSFSLVFPEQLYALCESVIYIIFIALNLIFDCFGLKFAVVVHSGLFTGRPFFYVPCVPYVPIQSNNIT